MTKRPTVLVVDDSEFSCQMLKNIFSKEDYYVLVASNGLIALDILKKECVDVVLLDIFMPKMNGFEVLSFMRESPRLSKIPVLVNTHHGEEQMEIEALKYGATDFITKPYNPDIILHRVRNVIEKTVLERQKFEHDLNDMGIRLQTLIDAVPGGIAIYETAGETPMQLKMTYFNDTLHILSGYSREEYEKFIKRDALFPICDDDRQDLLNEIGKTLSYNLPLKYIYRIQTKNKAIKWISLSAVKFKQAKESSIFYAVFMDVTEERLARKKIEQSNKELRYRAERDTLTGIYNREKFCRSTAELLKRNQQENYILIRWDIERFKVINELFGTEVGDRILMQFALVLYDTVKGKGTCGRLEADHFVICGPSKWIKPEELLEKLSHSFTSLVPDYNIVFCAGIFNIVDRSIPVDQMCDRAELALRTVKGNYMKRIGIYNDNFRKIILEEQEIVCEMNQALNSGQFDIFLQPIYNTYNNKIVSAESLVRWRHTMKGCIPPDLFVPIFERNGFISKMDAYVWEKTCSYISQLKQNQIPIVPVSVNISRLDLYNPKLCDLILELIHKYSIEPELLKLEITETAYTDNPNQLLEAMKQLQKCGFKIMIDDFGSGYSSLNMLKNMPADVLKIDMRFIDDLETSERAGCVLASMVQMAKSLQMEVVAEGVETKNQLDFLCKIGCDCVQGYYFSRPINTNKFTELLEKEKRLV